MQTTTELKRSETVATRFLPQEREQIDRRCHELGDLPLSDFMRLSVRLLLANLIVVQGQIGSYLRRFRWFDGDQAAVASELLILVVQSLGSAGEELAVKAKTVDLGAGLYWAWSISEGHMVRFGVVKCLPYEPLKKALGCPLTVAALDFAEWLSEEQIGQEFWFGGMP